MEKKDEIKGKGIELISIHGIPVKRGGVIQSMDAEGNYSVIWRDGTNGMVFTRGYVYRIENIPQKKLSKIKNLFLSLLNKFKNLYYGNKAI
jgi:hypothetical protein